MGGGREGGSGWSSLASGCHRHGKEILKKEDKGETEKEEGGRKEGREGGRAAYRISPATMFSKSWSWEGSAKGVRPVKNSKSKTPRDHQSTRSS